MKTPNHIYSKKEISKILSKASEIQTQKDLYGNKDGLTEQELLELAKEVGIDKDSLLEALNNVDAPEFESTFKWLSASSRIQDISIIDGEVSPELWEEIIQEIRRITGGIGKSSNTGKSLEWEQRKQEFGYKHISLTPQNGKVKFQYVSSWSPLKFMTLLMTTFLSATFALVAMKGLGYPKTTAILFAPLGGLIGFSFGMTFLKFYFNSEKKKLQNIVQSISKKIRSSKSQRIHIEEEVDLTETSNISSSKLKS